MKTGNSDNKDTDLKKMMKSMGRSKADTPPQPEPVRRSAMCLNAADLAKADELIVHAISLRQRINTTQALRLALYNWDFKQHLTVEAIQAVLKQDGRRTPELVST